MDDQDQTEKLAQLRKDNFLGYRHCPRCGTALQKGFHDDRERLACPSIACGFIHYLNPIPAAGCLVVNESGILLVRRAKSPRIGDWCLPAGFCEWEEHPTQTAVRELKEETGLIVELTDFFDLYSGNDDPRYNALLILYLAKIVGGQLEAADDALDARYFPFDALPDNIAFEAHVQALADYRVRFLTRSK